MSTERPGRLRIFIFYVIIILFPFVAIEAGARIVGFVANDFQAHYLTYGFGNPEMRMTTNAVAHDGYFKFEPNTVVTQGPIADLQIPSKINNIGLRGLDEVAIGKPVGSLRVVSMGGSSTFGYHARDEHTYPALLEAKLSASLDHEIEVINAGVPSYLTDNIHALFEKELAAYEPDIVTIYSAYNDATSILEASSWQRASRWLHDHVATYVALGRAVRALTDVELYSKWSKYVAAPSPEYVQTQIDLHVDAYRDNLEAVVADAEAIGATVVLIRQPMAIGYNSGDDRPDYADAVEAARARLDSGEDLDGPNVTLLIHAALLDALDDIAAAHDLPVVDNVRLVDENKSRLLTYVHLSEEGNNALAEALAKTIIATLGEDVVGAYGVARP